MALTLGTNVGFVAVAPTADPAGADTVIDGASVVVKHTSPNLGGTSLTITEIGWYRGSGTNTANFEVAIYADSAGVAGTRLNVDATNSSSSTGWIVTAVNWTISQNTPYWLAVQMDAHSGSSNIDSATSGGAGIDRMTSQTTLADPYGGGAVSDADGMYAIYAKYQVSPTVALNSPADASTTDDTTPLLTFTGTDANSEDIRYNVVISGQVTVGNSSTKQGATSSTSTFSHTTQDGANRLLLVNVATRGGPIASVTFDGTSLTKLQETGLDTNTENNSSQWYLLNPPIKTANIVVTRSYTNNSQCVTSCATNYFGVSQSTPFAYYTTTASSGSTPSITTTSQEYAVCADSLSFPDNGSGVTPSANGGQTELYVSGTTGDTRGCFSTEAGATSVTMGWTIRSETYRYCIASVTPTSENAVSGTNSGFSGSPDNTDPFTSGQAVSYTVQTPLVYGTYYWKVRGIDPSGSNAYGSFATARSLEVIRLPSMPHFDHR